MGGARAAWGKIVVRRVANARSSEKVGSIRRDDQDLEDGPRGYRRLPGSLTSRGFTGSGFQAAMVRAHARACYALHGNAGWRVDCFGINQPSISTIRRAGRPLALGVCLLA